MGIRGDNMAWQTPKTNWDTHPKAIEPSDMNRIEGNILVVREQISIPLRAEVVDSFPPHAAGRIIYHTGHKRAYLSDGSQWVPIGIEGDAEAKHVLEGKTFSSQVAGAGAVGAMPNRGAVTITPGTSNKTIPAGYHNGSGVVIGDNNLKSENILRGVRIFGVAGTAIRYASGTNTGSGTITLGWRPKVVTAQYRSSRDQRITWIQANTGEVRSYGPSITGAPSRITSITLLSNGFEIEAGGTYDWYAYELP
jgi:hypothetical protein